MDVPVYESERRVILRMDGRDPQVMRRVPIRSFDPIPAETFVGPAGFFNEVDAGLEPTAICVAPPGSKLVEVGGDFGRRLYLSALLPKLDKARPTVVDADSLLTWCKVGAYGLRLADRPVRAEADPAPEPEPVPEPVPEPMPEPELVHAGPADEPGPPPGFLF